MKNAHSLFEKSQSHCNWDLKPKSSWKVSFEIQWEQPLNNYCHQYHCLTLRNGWLLKIYDRYKKFLTYLKGEILLCLIWETNRGRESGKNDFQTFLFSWIFCFLHNLDFDKTNEKRKVKYVLQKLCLATFTGSGCFLHSKFIKQLKFIKSKFFAKIF